MNLVNAAQSLIILNASTKALFGLDAMSQPGGANGRADFFDAKLVTAVYFAQNVLSQTGGLVTSIRDGHRAINSFAEAAF